MTMPYVDQSASGLWLTLATGALDMNQFTVLAEGSLRLPNGVMRASIIGASHVLTFDGERGSFTEVLACVPEVRVEQSLERLPFPLFIDHSVQHPLYGYRFDAQAVAWEEGIVRYQKLLEHICSARGTTSELGLTFVFPDAEDAQPHVCGCAITALWVVLEGDDRVVIRTLHAYPTDLTMVFTTTTVELRQ